MPQSATTPVIRLGTRGSRLARIQTAMVREGLERLGVSCEIATLTTSGDRFQSGPLADSGGKGLFTKELEEALLERRIDLAVHSMKDVPAVLPKGLALAAYLPREDPRDAFLSVTANDLMSLPETARVGTSSVRRSAQLAHARPDLQSVLLRGNVDTRIGKLDSGQFDAIILASAGLKRLGLADRITTFLEIESWIPAPAQGSIGLEIRADDRATRALAERLNDKDTEIAVACERAFLAALDGSCRTPIAAHAALVGGTVQFRGAVFAPDGSDHTYAQFAAVLESDARDQVVRLGREAGQSLRSRAAPWLDL